MIRVRIVDPEHPHFGDVGSLKSKIKIDGRKLFVATNGCAHWLFDDEFMVEKRQIEVIRTGVI